MGGSLGVNCHGDNVGLGSLIESVHSLRIVLADGSIVTASRTSRAIFDAADGGHGGIGVIPQPLVGSLLRALTLLPARARIRCRTRP